MRHRLSFALIGGVLIVMLLSLKCNLGWVGPTFFPELSNPQEICGDDQVLRPDS